MKKKEAEKKVLNGEEYTKKVHKNLERLFYNKGVLTTDEGRAHVDAAVDFYVEKMSAAVKPVQVASVIYSEYAIKHFRGSIANGYSALWNSVYAAFRPVAALPAAIATAAAVTFFVAVCFAALFAAAAAVGLFAIGGVLYLYAGFTGLSVNIATALAFAGIGMTALGAFLLLVKPVIKFVKKSGTYVSVPIFALSICVRQIARAKRRHLTR